MDLKQRVDLTARVQDKRMAIPFDQLPLKHAIKEVHGNGSRSMAVLKIQTAPSAGCSRSSLTRSMT